MKIVNKKTEKLLRQWLLKKDCAYHPWEKMMEVEGGLVSCPECIAEGMEYDNPVILLRGGE